MTCPSIALPPSGMMKVRVKACQTSITRERLTFFSLVLLIFPRWRPDAIKGGEEEEEEEKTNLLTIQMRFYLISMVDPWFPISMNKAKHHSKEKPLDEAKIAELLDLLDNILAGLTE